MKPNGNGLKSKNQLNDTGNPSWVALFNQITNHVQKKLNPAVHREIKMLYIIDSHKKFDGTVINTITDGKIVDYTNGLTLEQYKKEKKNPHLILLTKRELWERVKLHRLKLMGKFREISDKEYYWLLECVPPKRQYHNCFFVGECYQYDLHHFCFTKNGRYFKALRSININKTELDWEMRRFRPGWRVSARIRMICEKHALKLGPYVKTFIWKCRVMKSKI